MIPRARTVAPLLAVLGGLSTLGLAAAGASPEARWLEPATLATAVEWTDVSADERGNSLAVWTVPDGETSSLWARFRPAGGDWHEAERVSADGENATGPIEVATGPRGDAAVVWMRWDGTYVIRVATRPAGGRFGPPQTLGIPGGTGPHVRLDANGGAVAVWDGATGVYAAARRPGGRFGGAQRLGSGVRPVLATNSHGHTIVVWSDSTGVAVVDRRAGGPFATSQRIFAPDRCVVASVALNDRGDAVVLWGERFGDVYTAFRPSGSREFGAPEELVVPEAPHNCSAGEVALDARGNAIALWSIDQSLRFPLAAAFRPVGGRFGRAQVLSEDAGGFDLAVAPTGLAVAVWGRWGGDYVVQGARAGPAATAFGPATDLSEAGYNAPAPGVAMDGQGNAVALWARSFGREFILRARGYDASGPRLSSVRIPARGKVGSRLQFAASARDVWSSVASVYWTFGDGHSARGRRLAHSFRRPGRFRVTVTATDALGHPTSLARTVRISRAKAP